MSDDLGPLVRALRAGPLSTAGQRLRPQTRVMHEASVLFGQRGVYRPTMALQTLSRTMGNARHALSQRTVAGMMEVHAPFAPDPKATRTPTPAILGPHGTKST